MKKLSFGEYVRQLRLSRQVSLRQFAKSCGFQASNYCHVENGTLNPTDEHVRKIVDYFGVAKGSEEHRKLLDLAAEARKGVPSDLQELIQNNKLIPALLRSVEDENIGPDVLRAIIEDIKSGRYKQTDLPHP